MLNKVKPFFNVKLKLLRISCYLLVSLEIYLCIIPIACLYFDSLFQDESNTLGSPLIILYFNRKSLCLGESSLALNFGP